MDPTALTLRVIPEPFTSLLLEPGGLWIIDIRREPRHPFAWVVDPELDRMRTPAERTRPSMRPRAGQTIISHAADRLARAIVAGTAAPRDPRTLTAWGQAVGASRGTLRAWCSAAGVSACSCLDFVRVLRAVVLSRDHEWDYLPLSITEGPRPLNMVIPVLSTWCFVAGHDDLVVRASGRTWLRCQRCDRETPGWTLRSSAGPPANRHRERPRLIRTMNGGNREFATSR